MTMTLWDLPVDPLPTRSTDPVTSRAAARQINHKERKREVMAAVRSLGRPATASEIHREMRRQGVIRDIGSVRSRLSQLRRDGLLKNTKGTRKIAKADGGTGCHEQVWVLA